MPNKVKFGLDDVHYAVATENNGVITYGAWAPLPNAVSLTGDLDSDTVNEYADNVCIYSHTSVSSETLTLEIEDLPEAFLTGVLKYKKDATSGALVQPTDAIKEKIALAFRMKGDEEHRIVCFFLCDCSDDTNDNAETNTDSVTFQHDSLTLVARPVELGNDIHYIKESLVESDAGYANFWTTNLTLPNV